MGNAFSGFYNSVLEPVGNAIRLLIGDVITYVVEQFRDWEEVAGAVFGALQSFYNSVIVPIFGADAYSGV